MNEKIPSHYLAFKGVGLDMRSAFIGGKLSRQYAVGKTMKSHPKFPFFLVSYYSTYDKSLKTGCDGDIKRLLVVKILKRHLVQGLPWLNCCAKTDERSIYRNMTLDEMAKVIEPEMNSIGLGATKLKVLCEVNMMDFRTTMDARLFFEKQYGLPFIS